jgi:regulator of RNase E activity RraA
MIDEGKALRFHFFSSCVIVSHVYVCMQDFRTALTVSALTVKPGDPIMGDNHGVVSIPREIAIDAPSTAQMGEDWERIIFG